MALILVGMDEAGFGPLLGPMCAASTTWCVGGWAPGEKAPDLWALMSEGVCRKPEAGGRIAVADSKKLKLANFTGEKSKATSAREGALSRAASAGGLDTAGRGRAGGRSRSVGGAERAGRHPLMHLERGVLAMMDALGRGAASDAELLASLGARAGSHPCYGGEAFALPLCANEDARAIAANFLRVAMSDRSAQIWDVWCETVDEPTFNGIIERSGNKAEVSVQAFGRLVGRAAERFLASAGAGDCLKIVCDRLGGRASYGDLLLRWFPGCDERGVVVVHESETLSRYVVHWRGHEVGVSFEVESESRHLPIACASMTAKFVRELCMQRFNRYWNERFPEVRPTAGYWQDAKRWLAETKDLIQDEDRAALVRRA